MTNFYLFHLIGSIWDGLTPKFCFLACSWTSDRSLMISPRVVRSASQTTFSRSSLSFHVWFGEVLTKMSGWFRFLCWIYICTVKPRLLILQPLVNTSAVTANVPFCHSCSPVKPLGFTIYTMVPQLFLFTFTLTWNELYPK